MFQKWLYFVLLLVGIQSCGGSDGALDTAAADYKLASSPPVLVAARSVGNTAVELTFSIALDDSSLDLSKITIIDEGSQPLTVSALQVNREIVTLTTASQQAISYIVTIVQISSVNQIVQQTVTGLFWGTADSTTGVSLSSASGITSENGQTASFTVALAKAPTADVTLSFTSSNSAEGTVSPANLTFTATNWNQEQTILVTGVDDGAVDGDQVFSIQIASSSLDLNYHNLAISSISMTNLDNDGAQILVSNINSTVSEGGSSAQFTMRLTQAPTADVNVALSSSDLTEGTVTPATITFTTGNWSIDQVVTVTGVDDALVDGSQGFTVMTAPASSSDGNYNGKNPVDVPVINMDNDSAGFTISSITGNTTENGGTATFTVRLNTAPSGDVTVNISSSDLSEGTVSPASLTFTSLNYATSQSVTVTGVNDTAVDGDISYSIILSAATSTDANYNGLNPPDMALQNIDNDESSTFDPATYGGYYKTITINTGASAIPDSYSVKYTFDHAALVSGSKSNADGSDVRLVYTPDGGTTWLEISRVLDDASSWNNVVTAIWFKTQAAVASGSTDSNYRIYYRNAVTSGALSSKSNVFDIYDDFTNLDQWALWQDDGDSSPQSQTVAINSSCGTADNSCVEINSGGSLLGGIRHKSYVMNNATDFIVFAKAKQSSAAVDMAPFIWYANSSTGKAYAYQTNATANRYALLADSSQADGTETAIDTDVASDPFADTIWHEFQLHHYTDGSLKVWRDGSQQFPVLGGYEPGLKKYAGWSYYNDCGKYDCNVNNSR